MGLLLLCSSTALSDEVPSTPTPPVSVNPTGAIALADALALALEQNLDLMAFSWDIRAAEARALQAGLRPNPEFSLEVEDLRLEHGSATRSSGLGFSSGFVPELQRNRESGSPSGLAGAEITVRLSQLIELGGKRSKRVRLANHERDVAAWDYEVARLNVLSETAKAFHAVMGAQARQRLAEELEVLARQTLDTVIARVDAGKVSPIERTQGEAEYALVRMDVERARQELDAARTQLAAFWGHSSAEFTEVKGNVDAVDALPPLDRFRTGAEASPDLARWMAEVEQRDALVALERANGKADLTVTLGLRSTPLDSTSDTSYGVSASGNWSWSRGHSSPERDREASAVLGFSLPLTFFNRNQGRILEAEHLAAKATAQKRAGELRIQTSIVATYSALESAHQTVQTLGTDVLPKAQEAFEATKEGYRLGKFSLLEVLLAERGLFNVRAELLSAQSTRAQLIVDLERLSGQPLVAQDEANKLHEEHK
jgi:cobalt-zinc-cadmium efflux system outer membrane protein